MYKCNYKINLNFCIYKKAMFTLPGDCVENADATFIWIHRHFVWSTFFGNYIRDFSGSLWIKNSAVAAVRAVIKVLPFIYISLFMHWFLIITLILVQRICRTIMELHAVNGLWADKLCILYFVSENKLCLGHQVITWNIPMYFIHNV